MARSNKRANQKITKSEHQDKASGSSKRRRPNEAIAVEDEAAALQLTSEQVESQLKRRVKNFFFSDADGKPQHVEFLSFKEVFVSGTILPLEEGSEEEKQLDIRCERFGPIRSWRISGYEEGFPVIWVSTVVAEYSCLNPANKYKKMYSMFFEKARACVEVYKKLSSCGGNVDLSVDELIASVTRAMSDSESFPDGSYIKDFIISQGKFIYEQLTGIDMEKKENDIIFKNLPVLLALRDASEESTAENASGLMPNKGLKIGSSSAGELEEDGDLKLARLLQQDLYWQEMNHKKGRRLPASSKEYYIKINEDEIAEDYPLPSYYKSCMEEIDEYLILDNVMEGMDAKENVLHQWSLYNSDMRFISLELLPLKPCAEIDVTIYGSGVVTCNDGAGLCLDGDSEPSAAVEDVAGLPVFLSAIKEWKIEYGSSIMFISIQTDVAWYRLGKPSKQYEPWYRPVLKTARLGVNIISMLKEERRAARFLFLDVIENLSKFDKDNVAFVSSQAEYVERYVVVHGPILLQQLLEYPDNNIKKCPFVIGLQRKMELRHHTKWAVKKKNVVRIQEVNMNPRSLMQPVLSKRQAMPATTTQLINRVWHEYYSNYSHEKLREANSVEVEEEADIVDELDENNEDSEEDEGETFQIVQKSEKTDSTRNSAKSNYSVKDIKWDGEIVGQTSAGEAIYRQASVQGNLIVVGCVVVVAVEGHNNLPTMCLVEFMFESKDKRKICHGRILVRGSETILRNVANQREVFLSNDCLEFELEDITETVVVEFRILPWGFEHRKANAMKDNMDRERAEERKRKGLPLEYYCRCLYCPEKGAFFRVPVDSLGRGDGRCSSCLTKESQKKKEAFELDQQRTGFSFNGTKYNIQDYVYVAPQYFATACTEKETFKSSRNVGLKAYAVCQMLDIELSTAFNQASPESTKVKVKKFYRPEDISAEKAYRSDIREVFYSEQILVVPIIAINGRCEVRRKSDIPSLTKPAIFEHIFFCEELYDPVNGATKQLHASVKFSSNKGRVASDAAYQKRKGKGKLGESDLNVFDKENDTFQNNCMATLDIFAGCGGLSEGLQQAGASKIKWAIEYEEPAAEAFRLNHPEAMVFVNNCNVILKAIMTECGDEDDCIATLEASEMAAKLHESEIKNLPRPGHVEFINGGPPCQGFSGMNRFNQSPWSQVQCEMILSFLSFVDYFRPRYFLLENVRNFVSFNKGQTFRLTLASLLEMGYQVRFGVLEAGAFGVSQSRKRAFIWAASPEEMLPEWPEPMHVFAGPDLKVKLSDNSHYVAVRSTANGAPFRSITVRDTIGDLPAVGNGASLTSMKYKGDPVSWFQKKIRGDSKELTDHISKEMNELNMIRCKRIPKKAGADWRDLPDEKVRLSTGQIDTLIPWCLPNTAGRHNQWKGLYGRLDWEGNFPTSITDPQPMGKVGMCFHPEQDRIVTVRECARSQGFPDSYKFAGNTQKKHRQVGNAVPPPLAYALGVKLKEALSRNLS